MKVHRIVSFAALLAGAFSTLFLVLAGQAAADVRVLLTKIDDGDAKHAKLESGDHWKCDIYQDENFTLLREGTVPLVKADPGRAIKLVIDRGKTYQTILGYGGAMTDASAFVLMNLKAHNPELYAYTMEKLFSPNKGAGFSFLRLTMGASDYAASKAYFTYCDQESRDLGAFNIDRDKEYVIPALKEALAINPEIKLCASPCERSSLDEDQQEPQGVDGSGQAAGRRPAACAPTASVSMPTIS